MDYKKSNAPVGTITYNRNEIDAPTENLYEAISIIAKRTDQINSEIIRQFEQKGLLINRGSAVDARLVRIRPRSAPSQKSL